mmetsp:Transcript_30363/g.34501  ORF Transcript_30363/g.34501 Transcript_30363/m.34501 type:complete len:377 (+) Transcript_30363:45-1175(+)|eukprot:CAMPEP_0114995580 /NCGR_PEP_ID=MMETSP0216-20121206/13813_1 /TAXON_ID=223996 /ORGANISM="Protocruzia adherens, Strain Boccale" /LENGTH=376 /DNA_ID=CAMNT_0002359647 /DNA_START=34 /DNA_END=1164 /DNA_ORIENTATION=+
MGVCTSKKGDESDPQKSQSESFLNGATQDSIHNGSENDSLASKEVNIKMFDLKKVIGRGSFGKVMLVQKKDNRKLYAMKILKKEAIAARNQMDHTKTERYILETVHFPFIVNLKFAFQTADKLYLVTEFCNGGELFFHLRKETRFSEARTRFYAGEIALALEYLHSKGVVYRDLKPENILLDHEGHIKLTDFGLSKHGVMNNVKTFTFCGTPEYLAPEILKGTGHQSAVDWWSLGALVYEMLDGAPPFYSKNRKKMFENILKHPVVPKPHFSDEAKSLVKSLLEVNPKDRLGYTRGAREIKDHPFFAPIDWDKLYRREIKPPFKPKVTGLEDLRHFDKMFTSEKIKDTPVVSNLDVKQKGANHYTEFTYKDPNEMS